MCRIAASVPHRELHVVPAPLRRGVEKVDERALHGEPVAGDPFAVDAQRPRGDAREIVGGAETQAFGFREVGAFGEEGPDRGCERVGHRDQVARGVGRGRHGAVRIGASDPRQPAFAVAHGQRGPELQPPRYAGADGDGCGMPQRCVGAEEPVGGREHHDARIGLRGLAAFGFHEYRFVERPFGDAGPGFASDLHERGPVGVEGYGRRVGFGPETLRASADREFQRRAVAAVVFGLDADAAQLPLGRAHHAALLHHRVETAGRTGQPGQADHFVARCGLERIAAHGVAAARQVVGEAVHAVFEIGDAVNRSRDTPDAERVVHAVAAVGDLGHEITLASRADGLFARQAVAAFGFADHGVALHAAAYRNALQGVHLDVVQTHDAGRQVVFGADDPLADDVVEPLRRGVADLEVEVRAHRRAAVARESDHVALLYGPRLGTEEEVDAVRPAGRALLPDVLLDVVAEALQVAVNGRRAVAQREVDGSAVAARREAHARDVAVGDGHQRFALRAVGLDVDARVEMPRAHLAEVGRVEPRHVAYGINVIAGIEPLGLRPGTDRAEQQNGQKSSHVSVSLTIAEAASSTASYSYPSESP